MGISTNQARLMTLTSRMHDLEQRAQQISNTKVISTLKSQTLALEYSNAINQITEDSFERTTENPKEAITGSSLGTTTPQIGGAGTFPGTSGNVQINPNLQVGGVYQGGEVGGVIGGSSGSTGSTTTATPTTPTTPTTFTVNGVQVSDIDAAKAAYDAATFEISKDEKLLDMELTQINTEYNAVTTEYDSVKSLISDNTDKSFSLFG